MKKSLVDIRAELDAIDNQILELLNERAKRSLEAKQTKEGQTSLRRGREVEVVKQMVAANQGPFSDKAIRDIFEAIVYNGRGVQLELQIGYLGPIGTYSEQAALEMFGNQVNLKSKRSLAEVAQALQNGEIHVGVLPVENSSEGAVVATHKILRDITFPIIAEHTMHIQHALLSKGDRLADIKKVYGHPQALGQCREWLNTNVPNAERIACASNAEGLELAKDKTNAAIAGERNALRYDMNILETAINDDAENTTRFIAFGLDEVPASGDDKTSLMCAVHDKAGALHELLGVLHKYDVSMTRLVSQPDGKGSYAFFIDILGHKDDRDAAEALKELEDKTTILKIFGSYPRELQ